MSTLDEILKEINKAESICLLTHENPDGDAIGTSLALYKQLKIMNKDVDLIIPKYSRNFGQLPGLTEAALEKGTKEQYDLAISVECATIKLLNMLYPPYACLVTINGINDGFIVLVVD